MDAVVKSVAPGSIADEIGINAGDIIVSINGAPLKDILDYRYCCSSDEYQLEVLKKNGDTEIIEIINDDYEQLGVEFENGLLDKPKVCRNKCLFCFVDQLPRGMRKTLYFKDDDYRLSALMGNYITLTNLSGEDVDRIIDMRLPRINVSVHSVDAKVRSELLRHENADVTGIMKRFSKAGINMNCQVVLCKGINDGKHLDNTILFLAEMYPNVQSLSVVPTGITKHREGLYPLEKYDAVSAAAVIEQVERHQKELKGRLGTSFVFASDEFYVQAKTEIPAFEYYEDFLQIENGVGLVASLEQEFNDAFNAVSGVDPKFTVVTSVSAYKYIRRMTDRISKEISVIPVTNEFFGDSVTVAGLITGQDIIKQLSGKNTGNRILIPSVMLNSDNLFLDDLTVADVERELGTKVVVTQPDGYDFFEKLTNE